MVAFKGLKSLGKNHEYLSCLIRTNTIFKINPKMVSDINNHFFSNNFLSLAIPVVATVQKIMTQKKKTALQSLSHPNNST